MKVLVVLSVLLVAALADSADRCYATVKNNCNDKFQGPGERGSIGVECNAKYGLFSNKTADIEYSHLQEYVITQIADSIRYLQLSSLFENYKLNRDGFKSLYRKLSDKSWDDAIDLIKFITKRGGVVDFNASKTSMGDCPKVQAKPTQYLSEIHSLAKALEIQKKQAKKVLDIYADVQSHKRDQHQRDGSVAHYLEERFMERQADDIRSLSGHITDLKKFIESKSNVEVSLFLFDEYLQKLV